MPIEVKCWRCGKTLEMDDEPQLRPYCDECASKARVEHKQLVDAFADLKRRVMIETALRKMERGGVYMHEYYDIVQEVKDDIAREEDKFLTADEIVAALVLKCYGIEYEANKRVGNYRVDFYIPDMHVCLEIDGDVHETRRIDDSKRDIAIRAELGAEWEVVRIPNAYLEKDPEKLLDAIDAIYAEKKKLRAKNNGIIPEHFSRRERDHYRAAAEMRTVKAKRWGSGYY